jgi:hypothetical protein
MMPDVNRTRAITGSSYAIIGAIRVMAGVLR